MPRKRWLTGFSCYGVRIKDPNEVEDSNEVEGPHEVADHDLIRDLVRDTLLKFRKLADLPSETLEQLVEDLAAAIYRARGGVKARKRHLSDKASGKHIFMRDVWRAMEQAGLRVTYWEMHEQGWGESLYYQIAHALSDVFGLHLPKDLGPLARWAAQIRHGKMSSKSRQHRAGNGLVLSPLASRQRRMLNSLRAGAFVKCGAITWWFRLRLVRSSLRLI